MIELDRRGEKWLPGEEHISIVYEHEGKPYTYRPDFIVGNRVIEAKPKRLQETEEVLRKKRAAEEYCAKRGMTYEFVDQGVRLNMFIRQWLFGQIVFLPKFNRKMVAWAFNLKAYSLNPNYIEEEDGPMTEFETEWLASLGEAV